MDFSICDNKVGFLKYSHNYQQLILWHVRSRDPENCQYLKARGYLLLTVNGSPSYH